MNNPPNTLVTIPHPDTMKLDRSIAKCGTCGSSWPAGITVPSAALMWRSLAWHTDGSPALIKQTRDGVPTDRDDRSPAMVFTTEEGTDIFASDADHIDAEAVALWDDNHSDHDLQRPGPTGSPGGTP